MLPIWPVEDSRGSNSPCRASTAVEAGTGALAGLQRGSWSPHRATTRHLEPSHVFGEAPGALSDPRRGFWSPCRPLARVLSQGLPEGVGAFARLLTRVLVPLQSFGDDFGVCRGRWRLWREKRRKEEGSNLGFGF